MSTDPIADTLCRIKNAQAVNKKTVTVPVSQKRYRVLKVLEKEGFLDKVEKKDSLIKFVLKKEIEGIQMKSKPGQRLYVKAKDISLVRGGYGLSLISTSQGVMSNKDARNRKLGGELLFNIW